MRVIFVLLAAAHWALYALVTGNELTVNQTTTSATLQEGSTTPVSIPPTTTLTTSTTTTTTDSSTTYTPPTTTLNSSSTTNEAPPTTTSPSTTLPPTTSLPATTLPLQIVTSHSVPQIALPCHLLPYTGYRYNNTYNYYALASNSIWMHQAESGDWVEFRSTLGGFNSLWKVRCVIDDNLIVLSDRNHVYSYQRNIARWFNLTSAPNETKVVWCNSSIVHIYSLETGHLVRHDTTQGKVISSRTNKFVLTVEPKTLMHFWFIPYTQHVYVIVERPINGSTALNKTLLLRSTTYSNSFNWVVLDEWELSSTGHPVTIGKTYTWSDQEDKLWLWRDLLTDAQLWCYDILNRTWEKHSYKKALSELSIPLLAWSDKEVNRICVFSSLRNCSSSFSLSRVNCLSLDTPRPTPSLITDPSISTESDTSELPPANAATIRPKGAKAKGKAGGKTRNKTSTKRPPRVHLLSTMRPKLTPVSSSASSSSTRSPLTTLKTTSSTEESSTYGATTEDPADEEMEGDELDMDLGSPWHDSESGVFNSIIFFATSVIAFCLVSVIWCVRHCAPFPKDTLLLRDPPSVRYTAIPDTIA